MDNIYQSDRRAGSTPSCESASRLQQLEAMAAATTQFSPELLALIRQERLSRTIELSNAMLQSSFNRDADKRSAVAPVVPGAGLNRFHASAQTFMVPSQSGLLLAPSSYGPVDSMIFPPPHLYPLSLQQILAPRLQQHSLSELLASAASKASQDTDHVKLQPQNDKPSGATRTALTAKTQKANDDCWHTASEDIVCVDSAVVRACGPVNRSKGLYSTDQPPPTPVCSDLTAQKKHTHHHSKSSSSISSFGNQSTSRRRYRTETFPKRLLRMIETAKIQGHDHLIGFTEDGKAIFMSNPKELAARVFPQYFVSIVD